MTTLNRVILFGSVTLATLAPWAALAQAPTPYLLNRLERECREIDVSIARPANPRDTLTSSHPLRITRTLYVSGGDLRPQDHPVPTSCTISLEPIRSTGELFLVSDHPGLEPLRMPTFPGAAPDSVYLESCPSRPLDAMVLPGPFETIRFSFAGASAPQGFRIQVECQLLDIRHACDQISFEQLQEMLSPALTMNLGEAHGPLSCERPLITPASAGSRETPRAEVYERFETHELFETDGRRANSSNDVEISISGHLD